MDHKQQKDSKFSGRKPSMGKLIVVNAAWDDEAHVWVATNEEIGLVTEGATVEALMQKLPGMILDLLEADAEGDMLVPFELCAVSKDQVRVPRRAA
jgi:hypothetical protein